MNSLNSETILHSPKLKTVIMVEKAIYKNSGKYTIYQMWKALPKKMMYQTFKVILDYLESSGKIIIDKDNVVIWTYDPEMINKILSSGVKLR